MNKFCINQIVRVVDLSDGYFGRLAKVLDYKLDESILVYRYEIKFLEKNPNSDRYIIGSYPEFALSEVYDESNSTGVPYYIKEGILLPLRVGDMVEVNNSLDAYYGRKGTIEDITGTIYKDGTSEKLYIVRFPPYVGNLPIKRKYSAKDLTFIIGNHSDYIKNVLLSDAEKRYVKNDEKSIKEQCYEVIRNVNKEVFMGYCFGIKKVHFSGPVTCVVFNDGSKAVVRCQEGDTFDPEKGLAMAICKKLYGTNKSGSNYYDKLEKWLPKKEKSVEDISDEITDAILNGSSKKEVKKLVKESMDIIDSKKDNNPCNDCSNRKRGCITNCEPFQNYIDSIQEKPKAEPIKPGYFVEHSKERKEKIKISENPTPEKEPLPMPISYFVEKFEASMFPAEFINFCKKNNLYFYVVDQVKGGLKKIDPYHVNWQQVTGYLKKGLMDSCKKVKYHKNSGSTFLAVNMDQSLFQRLPIELREVNRKEEK